MSDGSNFTCVMKPCARCGLSRGMRSTDTVCAGCSGKLTRIVADKNEEILRLGADCKAFKLQVSACATIVRELMRRGAGEPPEYHNLFLKLMTRLRE